MDPATVRSAPEDERELVVPTVVLAFATDPLVRWIWPDAHAYLRNMPKLIDAFAGAAFAHGSAYVTDDRAGAALWLPPGVAPDGETMGALVQTTAPPSVLADLPEVSQQMASFHPHEPHWYLPLIGVDPARQGCGLGAVLMKHVARALDRAGALAYLESTNPRNIALYERHGFEALGRIKVGGSPPIVPMVRRPA